MRVYGRMRFEPAKSAPTIDKPRQAHWRIDELEPQCCIRLKDIFRRIPRGRTVPFLLPDVPDICADLQWFIGRYAVEICSEDLAQLAARAEQHYQMQESIRAVLAGDYTLGDLRLKPGERLRRYQAQAAVLARQNGVLLLGDSYGLGKTYAALAACLSPEYLPALAVVLTNNTEDPWEETCDTFTYLRSHTIPGTRPYELPEADLVITTYHRIAGWVDALAGKFNTIIFDQVEELRTGTRTQKGMAARSLCRPARLVMGLSGSPVWNYADELWNILNIMKEGCLGSKHDFAREWGKSQTARGQVVLKDPKAFGAYLREVGLMLRRRRAEVGRELPPEMVHVETLPFEQKVVDDQRELARTLALQTLHGSFTEQGQAGMRLKTLLRRVTGLAKAKSVAAFVRMLIESGEPVLLAGWHHAVYDVWLKELADLKPVFYTGKESARQKLEAKRRFVRGETDLAIMSLRSGRGINGLETRCSTLVIGELDWSPQVHKELLGRLRRGDQSKPVQVIYLVTNGGSDPTVMDVCGLKRSQSEGVMNPDEELQPIKTDASRVKTLARRYLESIGEKPVERVAA